MRNPTILAALCLGLAAPVAANVDMPSPPGGESATITISCYRGPMRTVAWDRPNAVFVDSLMRRGYSIEQAEAIGSRVCRDEYGVHDPDHLVATLNRLLAETRPARR
jgi:hypothetical protein